ncbi:MAG: sporulation stage IV protein A [Oscillospiraceae bacterium]
MFQTNIETEISPEIGGENASSEILGFLLQGFDGDVEQLWQSIFSATSRSTRSAQEAWRKSSAALPAKAVGKLQETLQRVVNEGSGTLICIIFVTGALSGVRFGRRFERVTACLLRVWENISTGIRPSAGCLFWL